MAGHWAGLPLSVDAQNPGLHPDRHHLQQVIDCTVYICYHGVAGSLVLFWSLAALEALDHQSSAMEQPLLRRADRSIIT